MALTTTNLAAEWVAKRAAGTSPGVNTPGLTTTWQDNIGSNDATLYTGSGGFAATTSSGWDGDGSSGDPYCLVSDGTNDYCTFTQPAALSTHADFSIEIWTYVASQPSVNTNLFGGFVYTTVGLGVQYFVASDGTGSWIIGDNTATPLYAADQYSGYGASWQQHVLTYNAATHYAYPYRNAHLEWDSGVSGVNFQPYSGTHWIFFTDTGRPTTAIATARIYSVCLTAQQVLDNYNAGVTAASTDSAPALTTTAITAITATTASSGGTITSEGSSAVTQYGVVWATHTLPVIESDDHTHDKP